MFKWKKILIQLWHITTALLALLFIIQNFVLPNFYKFRNTVLMDNILPIADSLSSIAIQSNDVPITAFLFYDGKLIGTGYNTVEATQNICAHAELNALSQATTHLGLNNFKKLDKNRLSMVSSFEPCMMCRGALIENGIHHTSFMLPKSTADNKKRWKQEVQYYFHRQQGNTPYFQYQWFLAHPEFDPDTYPYQGTVPSANN